MSAVHRIHSSPGAGERVLLGIAGSLRRASYNRALLDAAGEELPPSVQLRIFEGLAAIPPFDEDGEGPPAPAAVEALRRSIRDADAVLIATPEYNLSIPGVLKNALDWASRPYGRGVLAGKPVAVIGASPGRLGGIQAQQELRKVLRACRAVVLDAELAVGSAHERFDEAGRLRDEEVRDRLDSLTRALLETAPSRDSAVA